jgi:hypothetical protein
MSLTGHSTAWEPLVDGGSILRAAKFQICGNQGGSMSRRAEYLKMACVAAISAISGPALADTLEGFAGFVEGVYGHSTFSGTERPDGNSGSFGLGLALPVNAIPNLNWQIDASYAHVWDDDFSSDIWTGGGDVFWATQQGRAGIDFHYSGFRDGDEKNAGVFGEYYINNFLTFGLKGGWAGESESIVDFNGYYVGGAAVIYPIQNVAITPGISRREVAAELFGTDFTVGTTKFFIDAELLVDQDTPISVFGGFAYDQHEAFNSDFNESIWKIGLRWYTGQGSLAEHHRNGTLRAWLRGT